MSVLPTLSVEGVIKKVSCFAAGCTPYVPSRKIRRIETVYVVPFNPWPRCLACATGIIYHVWPSPSRFRLRLSLVSAEQVLLLRKQARTAVKSTLNLPLPKEQFKDKMVLRLM